MSESSKTIAFVLAAVVMTGLAATSYLMNQPKTGADFVLVGQPFYEDFISSEQAQSLEVAAIDGDTMKLQRFSVENSDGLWRIPSHHNYPAEAAARLATTATSVMGIERESLAGRLEAEHEKLGVLDPLSGDVDDPEAAGKRITLKDDSGEVVVDYIIGKEAGEVETSADQDPFGDSRSPTKYFYVRRPDEKQTYKVKLDVDLSTRFADWIDPDLLRLERNKLIELAIDNYALIEESRNPLGGGVELFKEQGDKVNLSRASSTDPWTLEGLDDAKEELDSSRINDMVSVLEQLRIAGVRPKSKFKGHVLLTPELKLNRQPEFEQDPQGFRRAIAQLQDELDEKGFNLAGTAEKMELVSQQGQLEVGTDDGVRYTIQFGKEVEGEEQAIEIGGSESTKPEESSESGDEEGSETPDESDESAKNRYLMIRVSFDESLLGDRPTKPEAPVEPTKPEGYEPAPEKEAAAKDNGDANQDPGETEEDAAPKPEEEERNPEFVKYDEDKAAFDQAKIEYELALSRFETESEQFESRIEEGKKLVDELNERFGEWFYVITAANLKAMKNERADLVNEKEIPEDQQVPETPNISFPPSELDDDPQSESGEEDNSETGTDSTDPKEGNATPTGAGESKPDETAKGAEDPSKGAEPKKSSDGND